MVHRRILRNEPPGRGTHLGRIANTKRSKPVRKKRGIPGIKQDPIKMQILERIRARGVAALANLIEGHDRAACESTVRVKLGELANADCIGIARGRGSGRPLQIHLLPKGEEIVGRAKGAPKKPAFKPRFIGGTTTFRGKK